MDPPPVTESSGEFPIHTTNSEVISNEIRSQNIIDKNIEQHVDNIEDFKEKNTTESIENRGIDPTDELTWESVTAEISAQSSNYEIVPETHAEIITTETVTVSHSDVPLYPETIVSNNTIEQQDIPLDTLQQTTEIVDHSSTVVVEDETTEIVDHSNTEVVGHETTEIVDDSTTEVVKHEITEEIVEHQITEVMEHESTEVGEHHETAEIMDHETNEIVDHPSEIVEDGTTTEVVMEAGAEVSEHTTSDVTDHAIIEETSQIIDGTEIAHQISIEVEDESETSTEMRSLEISDDQIQSTENVDQLTINEVEGGEIDKHKHPNVVNSPVMEESIIFNNETVVEPIVEEFKENNSIIVENEKLSEQIQITELKPDEESQINEVIENVEYTVIEAEDETIISQADSSTEEIVLVAGETVVIENVDETENDKPDEISQEEILYVLKSDDHVEELIENEEKEDLKDVKPKKPRGRKPISDIPLHVLGRDITKPKEGVSNGGRVMPKPRLGVKVPYKNLTSQIVSKDEIQKEIMERLKQKQEHTIAPGDVLFARRITQRLAKKLLPAEKKDDKIPTVSKTTEVARTKPVEKVTPSKPQENISKMNNSDLLAILEGNDDPITVAQHTESEVFAEKEQFVKDIEKKIALEQLKELPITNKNRIFKSRVQGENSSKPTENVKKLNDTPKKTNETAKSTGKETAKSTGKETAKSAGKETAKPTGKETAKPTGKETVKSTVKETVKSTVKETVKSTGKETVKSTVKTYEKRQVEVEPQIKMEQVVKTYTRKRKSFELDAMVPLKKQITIIKSEGEDKEPDVYITKSSRVIKKKIIWDPDEVPSKSPTKSFKPAETKSIKNIEVRSPKATANDTKVTKTMEARIVKVSDSKVKSADVKLPTSKSDKAKISETKSTKSNDVSPQKQKIVEKKVEKEDKSFEKKMPTPIKKASPPKKAAKRPSEVDRLLMDEGAVNMLYDVNNDPSPNKKKNKDVISLDRAQKELISKTNVIKNELQKNKNVEQPKALRKKDSPKVIKREIVPGMVIRKKSKDSTKSSVHSPPASPGFAPAEASRIIRRHSSSSFSSNDELDDKEERTTKKTKNVNNVEPPKKKMKKAVESTKKPTEKEKTDEDEYKTFAITKVNKLVSIELNYTEAKYYLNEDVLRELTACLKELGKDDECTVVSITSSGGDSFCHGLDYRCLVVKDTEVRKKKAMELAVLVKDFLRCLLHFPKVLVAGIQGDCVGLGVTMLPLFDMVIASDTSTFSTPYSTLGSAAEGGFLLTVPRNSHGLASELLYTSQTIKAEDALRGGLITRLCWPEKYHNELKNILAVIAKQSRQSIEANKAQLRHHFVHSLETLLNSSMKAVVEQWQSAECQKNFSQYRIEMN